ncbi:MAG: hypothetical protein JNL50_00940 [Phycisphaerae bacterium]|nr:hypothetical protein [Phycisphaerae bacterium]
MKVTKRQRNGLLILALGLGALAVDRLVLAPGSLGPKQAAALGEALGPVASATQPRAALVSVADQINALATPPLAAPDQSLAAMFSDPAWVKLAVKPEAVQTASTTDDQGKAHTITGVVWGRAPSIILDGELLKAGQPGKSGRVLRRLDEERNLAVVRVNGRDAELAIPESMRTKRDRATVPPATPASGGPALK